MFGVHGSGDTSGFGGCSGCPPYAPAPAERPYGGWFDEVADELVAAMASAAIPPQRGAQTTVDRGEITFYVAREHLRRPVPHAARRRVAALRAGSSISGRRLRRGRRRAGCTSSTS